MTVLVCMRRDSHSLHTSLVFVSAIVLLIQDNCQRNPLVGADIMQSHVKL